MQPSRDLQSANSDFFSAVGELEETARAVAWTIEYRQMGRGRFSTEFATLLTEKTSDE